MSNRMERANSEINKCLAQILDTKLEDPRLGVLITITNVNTTPDFKYCKVLISIMQETEEEKKATLKLLQKSEGFIKKELARMLRLPEVPKIIFELDKGADNSVRINEILKTLNIPKNDEE